ncbi:latent-transforming growth factor beta-binding protein 1-like [Ptychodera flava]|uniref:latent-transforming growth factor beta-binding protein 1-like n=1 Tax=Ptychodera flava TaxID=63121 RepID=UPI00396A7997
MAFTSKWIIMSAVFTVIRSQGLVLVVGPTNGGPNVCGNTCCRGWRLNPSTKQCTIPICGCLNGGRCIAPRRCYCPSGFTGNVCQYRAYVTSQPPIITTEPLLARETMRGPCFRVVTMDECKAPLTNMYTLHDDCCSTVGKAWGNPCFICPQQIGRETDCQTGFKKDRDTEHCVDINECVALQDVCGNGSCRNTYGSYRCVCNQGYTLDSSRTLCVASVTASCYRKNPRNMCSDPVSTPMTKLQCCCSIGRAWGVGEQCEKCPSKYTEEFRALCPYGEGYQVTSVQGQKLEIDECETIAGLCKNGRCLNTIGSFRCLCNVGYKPNRQGNRCVDDNECDGIPAPCSNGDCINTKGSYYCVCPEGYHLTEDRQHCMDIDECVLGNFCNGRRCLNTLGSYHCMQLTCGLGYKVTMDGNGCEDIDECEDESTCLAGGCINDQGGYHCVCYQGYMPAHDGRNCIDINECDVDDSICGEGKCVNLEGSFVCECEEGFTFHRNTKLCTDESKKDCYTNLNELHFCENIIGTNITRDECCCSLGEGWGDNCNLWPCPLLGSRTYNELCPGGNGKILVGTEQQGYHLEDIDECSLFDGLCTNGQCVNTPNGYQCECTIGFKYNLLTRECIDIDECLEMDTCHHGTCENTIGSYRCECDNSRTLDDSGQRCIVPVPVIQDTDSPAECWTELGNNLDCNSAVEGQRSTYSECCCEGGAAWGSRCRLCPLRNSDEYALLCADYFQRQSFRSGPHAIRTASGHAADTYGQGSLEWDCGLNTDCVNGRCLRTQTGYTCECYSGYKLDRTRSRCIDINECRLFTNLCWNARCINMPGSFRCLCLPGHVETIRNFCIRRPYP